MKFDTKLSHFSWTEVNEMNPRVILCSKPSFLPSIQIGEALNKNLRTFLAELDYILQKSATNYGLLEHFTAINRMPK
jgi:hypothetical protein